METITSFIDGGGNVLIAASSDIGQFIDKSFTFKYLNARLSIFFFLWNR